MLVSVITVCLNSGATIRQCLESIRNQTYKNIEAILVDGGSIDDTLAIAKEYSDIVSLVITEPDKGIYDAMNKGLLAAKGDIIGILNSDDRYAADNVVSYIVAAFQEQNCDCVHGDLVYTSATDSEKILRFWKSGPCNSYKFYFGWMPPHPTFYIKKEVFQQCGFFDTSLGTAADYEYMLRVIVKYEKKGYYIPKVLIKMQVGGVSNRSIMARLKANREDRNAWRVNNLKPYFFTILLKPLRKIHQFFILKNRD